MNNKKIEINFAFPAKQREFDSFIVGVSNSYLADGLWTYKTVSEKGVYKFSHACGFMRIAYEGTMGSIQDGNSYFWIIWDTIRISHDRIFEPVWAKLFSKVWTRDFTGVVTHATAPEDMIITSPYWEKFIRR